jgi:hypothetical protein
MDYHPADRRLAYPEGSPAMPDDDEAHRGTTDAQSTRAPGLTVDEIREFAALRVMMRSGAYMTEVQRGRWFELWQRHDPMRG